MGRYCAISVDLDELPHYFAIHGLRPETDAARHAVYDLAIARLSRWADSHGFPLTWFAIASDLRRSQNAARLREAVRAGHEVANHSLDHRYDLTRLSHERMVDQVAGANELIEQATGQRPTGFRAPGYTINPALVRVLEQCRMGYDSSVFPCPPYYLAKAATLLSMVVRRRHSASILDRPSVLLAPRRPYRWASRRPAAGLLELPIQVTRTFRLPYIGTLLTLVGERLARRLTRDVIGEELVNLELHGIDALDASDGLESLRAVQPDVRVPWSKKQAALTAAVAELRAAGYEFVRLDEAARRFA